MQDFNAASANHLVLTLLLATRNAHKTREFAALLGRDFDVADLTRAGDLEPVEENGATFEENAVLKATAASRARPGLVVADDSGLEVEALGGAPGIRSARYAGGDATDEANVTKLLAALGDDTHRAAQFRCVLALAENGRMLAVFEGQVHGRITHAPAGGGGFGYDPVFVPDGYDKPFGELGSTVKNAISHRSRAVDALREYLLQNKKGGDKRRP